jgi:hypothetical protein
VLRFPISIFILALPLALTSCMGDMGTNESQISEKASPARIEIKTEMPGCEAMDANVWSFFYARQATLDACLATGKKLGMCGERGLCNETTSTSQPPPNVTVNVTNSNSQSNTNGTSNTSVGGGSMGGGSMGGGSMGGGNMGGGSMGGGSGSSQYSSQVLTVSAVVSLNFPAKTTTVNCVNPFQPPAPSSPRLFLFFLEKGEAIYKEHCAAKPLPPPPQNQVSKQLKLDVVAPSCRKSATEKLNWAMQYGRKLFELACGANSHGGIPNPCAHNEGATCNSGITYAFSSPSYSLASTITTSNIKSQYSSIFSSYMVSGSSQMESWNASLSANVTIPLAPTQNTQCSNPAFHPNFPDVLRRAEQAWDDFCRAAQ